MSGFMYYFPGDVKYQKPEEIPVECGLGHLLGSVLTPRGVDANGPDGSSGWIVSPNPENKEGESPRIGIYPKEQEWVKVENEKGVLYWLGWEKANRPSPVDTERKHPINGWPVDMGGVWSIPCVHVPITTLPRRFVMHSGGPSLEVTEEYAAICQMAAEWYKAAAVGDFSPTYLQAFNFAVALLSVNYRLGPWEISALGLLDTRTTMDVVDAGIGVPLIAAEVESKKKDDIPTTG